MVEKVSFEPGMKYVNVMEGDSGEQVEDDRWIRECDIISLFVCLGFNDTFSTNRLYHAITVG